MNTQPNETQDRPRGYARSVWQRFRHSRRGLVGMSVVILLISIAFLAPVIASNQPIVCSYKGAIYFPAMIDVFRQLPGLSVLVSKSPPFSRAGFDAREAREEFEFAIWPPVAYGPLDLTDDALASPSAEHWLGTDDIGRDLAARMVHGAAVSVQVGIVSMGIAALIGITLGALAGYAGGWIDATVSRLIEVVICFPDFFLILSVMVWLEPNITNVMVVIGLTRWTSIARYTRGECMRLNRLDYVTAARASGAGPLRIIFKHLLPNAMAPVLVTVMFGVAAAILLEAGLSWLGFGVQAPQPSWGNILRSAYTHIRVAPHMVYPPCVAIFVSVLVYNLVGDALRDALDPRVHGRKTSG